MRAALLTGGLSSLAACGGGEKTSAASAGAVPKPTPTPDSTPTPAPIPVPPPSPLTLQEASRFLAQATNGATKADIVALAENGIDQWLAGQFAMMRDQSHWNWMKSRGFDHDPANANYKAGKSHAGWDCSIWRQLITAPDQLRQRVALALLDIMVVSLEGIEINWPQFALGAYMDVLLDHAFGDFRKLLAAITTSPAMGSFLTFIGSRRATEAGTQPDENYARELLQLFTIGLYQLNQDGSVKTGANGLPIETYTQEDVSQLARVFTGFRLSSSNLATPDPVREPLVIDPAANETGPSTFLGSTVSGGGMTAVNAALDAIFNHPNVPPFISRSLIQRLVTSNPSPGYIERVAGTFSNNGSGMRGDLRAVVYAILTDPEARSDLALAAPHAGKLRDPIQRFTHWARAFSARSASGGWYIGNKSSASKDLGQSPGRSPSVFNFFRPGYTPPNSELAMRGLVAPEFQITNEQAIVGYINTMLLAIKKGVASGDVMPDYAPLLPLAPDAAALMAELNLVLAAGQLSPASLGLIRSAIEGIDPKRGDGAMNRIRTAILLTMASPEYLVLK